MEELEVNPIVTIVEAAAETVVSQTVVVDLKADAFLDEINEDVAELNLPVDVVSHIVPGGIAVVVYPVTATLGIRHWIFEECDLRICGIVRTASVIR